MFVKPPSLDELEKRLRARGTETEESLRKRLDTAKRELEYEKSVINAFDLVVINDDLEAAYSNLKKFIDDSVLSNLEKK